MLGGIFLVFWILIEHSKSKQWRPWSDGTECCTWSGSALFGYVPQKRTLGLYRLMSEYTQRDFLSVLFCYAFMHVCLLMPCGHLLGKGWPLGSRLWCLIVTLSLSHWYPGSGVVLDCIDSWSLSSFYQQLKIIVILLHKSLCRFLFMTSIIASSQRYCYCVGKVSMTKFSCD